MQKHAYLIIAHNNFYTLDRLLRMLDSEYNDIFLHIDRRVKSFPKSELERCVSKSKLFFTRRIAVYWGDRSQVDCEMLLLEECLKNGKYDWVHLLSGVDLPIKKQDYIYDFFAARPNTQFLQIGKAENHLWRLDRYNFFVRDGCSKRRKVADRVSDILLKRMNVHRLKKYGGMKIVKTANWFSVTGDCAEYILSRKRFISKLVRFSVCADEMFLGTVLFASDFGKQVFKPEPSWDGHMRYIDRQRNVGASPHTFVMNDADSLLSSEMLFARKFDENIDRNIIDLIYKEFSPSERG